MAKTKDLLKLPPQDLDAEQSVLGALMIDKDAIYTIVDILNPSDFYKKAHSLIYETIFKLWERHEPIDILSVTAELRKNEILKEVGGSAYLTDLVNSVPTSSHVLHYGKIVKEKRTLRELINASAEITDKAFHPENEDIDSLLDLVEQRIFSISQQGTFKNFVPISEELKGAYERIENLHKGDKGEMRGVPTGFIDLDNILSGLQKSDLIIVGARPSYGKSSLCLDIARNAAVKYNLPVGIFSLEMSREQVVDRLIAAESGVDLWQLRTGRLKEEVDFEMVQSALDRLSRAPLFIDDTPSPNIIQIRSMARRLQAEHKGLALLVVDYLQLIQGRTNYESVVQQVTEISRGLKSISRELNIPVIAVSQLSRAVDQREGKMPRLSDLRESGSIEQDADVVMLIHPKDRGPDTPPNEQNVVEIIIAKHRNGPTGSIGLFFDKNRASFSSLEKRNENTGGY
jgi:replicative DNA helicase